MNTIYSHFFVGWLGLCDNKKNLYGAAGDYHEQKNHACFGLVTILYFPSGSAFSIYLLHTFSEEFLFNYHFVIACHLKGHSLLKAHLFNKQSTLLSRCASLFWTVNTSCTSWKLLSSGDITKSRGSPSSLLTWNYWRLADTETKEYIEYVICALFLVL